MEPFSFFGLCHVTFPYKEPPSFFGRFVRLLIIVYISDSFLKLPRAFRMAAVKLQTIPSFYRKTSEKSLFTSANTYKKYIVCKDYCITHHDDITFFLPACKNHIILLGNVEELLKKLDTICFTYQHVDCLYTVFKYRFRGKVIVRSGQVFDSVL